MKYRRSLAVLLATVVMLGVLLSACAPAATPTPAPTAPPKPAAAAPTAAAPAPAATAAPKPAATTAPAAAAPTAAPKPTTAPAAKPTAAAQPVAVNMAVLSNILYSPYYVGVEKEIFLKHGIDLKLKLFPGANDVIKAVQAGDAQFGVGAWAGIAPAKAQGVDIKVFYLIASDPLDLNYDLHNGIVVRPGLTIAKVEDLAGRKIASSAGGGTDTWLRVHLTNAKVPFDKVEFLNVAFPNMLAALQSGADAAAAPEPYLSLIEATLKGSTIPIRGGKVSNSRIFTITMADVLSKNPALAEQFWVASAEASQYARQHPDETAVAASHFLSGVDLPIARKALNYVNFDARLSPKVLQAFDLETKQLLDQKKIQSAPNASDVLVTSLMESLPKKYPQYFTDLKPLPAN